MPTFRIPTPLRPYSGGNSQVAVTGVTVGDALVNLTDQYPDLRQHLYDGKELRSFVNIYLNQEDIRYGEGVETAVEEEDTLMIIPSIAGGNARRVDQSILRVNQAFIITLLVTAFVLGSWQLAAFVGFVMLLGTAYPSLALFKQIYQRILRPAGLVKPDVIADNPEPHRFAQGFGGVVVSLAVGALILGLSAIGWVLLWLVVLLAGFNLFLGFCAGCFIYYQFNRLDVPGFEHSPIR
jgi:molybdopterin converting factor small subunit